MQAKTISRLVNEAVAEGKDPGEWVASIVKQEQDIKLRIRLSHNDLELAKTRYKEQADVLKKGIREIQELCPHLEFTYYGDPSGGNDSHYSCDWCEKEW